MQRLQARKLILKEVPYCDASKFLNEYHIQGEGTCKSDKLRIGLYNSITEPPYYELVQLLTFRRYRGMTFNWECARACSKKDYYIAGGLSRLMTYAANELGGKIGFAIYPELYDGHSMQKAGFTYIKTAEAQNWHNLGITKVDYYQFNIVNTSIALGCIYKITFSNNKVYIGKHDNCIEIRKDKQAFIDNYRGSGVLLPEAGQQFTYEIEIIDYYYDNLAATHREAYWIKYYNSTNDKKGYNILEDCQKPVTEGKAGELYHQRLSRAHKELFKNPEFTEQAAEYGRAFWRNNTEAREKARQKTIEQFSTEEARKENSERLKKVWEDTEKRKAQSKKIKAYFEAHPEAKEKLRHIQIQKKEKKSIIT